MTSPLKTKLAAKLNSSPSINQYFDEIQPEDIVFVKNGRRDDVVRWELGIGVYCFSAGYFCMRNDVYLTYNEDLNEIFAELKSNNLPVTEL